MPNTFEQTVATLVENRVASEHPNLLPYRRGFVLLDFDEDAQKALGVYRFLIGTVPVLMPAVYRTGELTGLDILIIRDLPLFVPAIDGWITFIAESGAQALGELVPEKVAGKGPSQVTLELRSFPYALKTAESVLTEEENKALRYAFAGTVDTNVLHAALVEDYMERWFTDFPKGAALLAKAAEAEPLLAESLSKLHGDSFVRMLYKQMYDICPDFIWTRHKASPVPPLRKVSVITDIGDPLAAALRPSEKRVLLQKGQFIVDHRAESETSLVVRSPDSNVFQTCSGAGIFRVLTADGDFVNAEICFKVPINDFEIHNNSDVYIIPFSDYAPRQAKMAEIYTRPVITSLSEDQLSGVKANVKDVVNEIKKVVSKRNQSDKSIEDNIRIYAGTVIVVCRGYAYVLGLEVENINAKDPEKIKFLSGCDKYVKFTNSPGNVRIINNNILIPSNAKIYIADASDDKKKLILGTPQSVKTAFTQANIDLKEFTVDFRDGVIHIRGAINKVANSENDAMTALVFEGNISAKVAASILQDVKARPKVVHSYLLKKAEQFNQDEESALGSLILNTPQKFVKRLSPELLNEQGNNLAKDLKKAPEEELDENIIKRVLALTDFRDITADSVRKFAAAMDEAGKMLLRVLVHRDRYEERFGEDVENMESELKDSFIKNGSLALFLREKRSNKGLYDTGEELMNLLTKDMG